MEGQTAVVSSVKEHWQSDHSLHSLSEIFKSGTSDVKNDP